MIPTSRMDVHVDDRRPLRRGGLSRERFVRADAQDGQTDSTQRRFHRAILLLEGPRSARWTGTAVVEIGGDEPAAVGAAS